MDRDVTFFVAEAVRHGLALPLSEAVPFLRGLVFCAEGRINADDQDQLRSAVMRLVESDGQLRLLSLAPEGRQKVAA